MATPAYTICAGNKSEDRETNALSLFAIVERVAMDALGKTEPSGTPEPEATASPAKVPSAFTAIVLSVWLKDDSDYGAAYEAEFCMVSPSGDAISTPLPSFTMMKDAGSFLHRIMVRLHGLPPLNQGGVWMMETRIRLAGSTGEWIKQGYPLVVDVTDEYVSVANKHISDNETTVVS